MFKKIFITSFLVAALAGNFAHATLIESDFDKFGEQKPLADFESRNVIFQGTVKTVIPYSGGFNTGAGSLEYGMLRNFNMGDKYSGYHVYTYFPPAENQVSVPEPASLALFGLGLLGLGLSRRRKEKS